MNIVVDYLTNERKELEEIIIKAEQSLKTAPEGILRVSKSGNTEQYVSLWESRKYSGKEFFADAPEIYTEKGERVRSKSEKIIADKLRLMNIPYLYECPLYLKGYGIVYPDFTLLNKRTRKEYYLEHFGRMDDAEYSEKVVRKIETYQKNGIYPGEKLLMTYETGKSSMNMKLVEQMVRKYLL